MALTKIGAFWKPDASKGKTKWVLRGKLDDGRKVFIFKNDRKEQDKHPDFTIHAAEDDAPATADDFGAEEAPF